VKTRKPPKERKKEKKGPWRGLITRKPYNNKKKGEKEGHWRGLITRKPYEKRSLARLKYP
jgi:hypothetical protein